MPEDNKVRNDKTYHITRDNLAYHYIRSQVEDGQCQRMWLKIKECLQDKTVVVLGYVSTPIVQMAIENELQKQREEQDPDV